jgi:hypothetical protein
MKRLMIRAMIQQFGTPYGLAVVSALAIWLIVDDLLGTEDNCLADSQFKNSNEMTQKGYPRVPAMRIDSCGIDHKSSFNSVVSIAHILVFVSTSVIHCLIHLHLTAPPSLHVPWITRCKSVHKTTPLSLPGPVAEFLMCFITRCSSRGEGSCFQALPIIQKLYICAVT